MTITETRTDARLWTQLDDFEKQAYEGDNVNLEVEADSLNRVLLHTFIEGRGSLVSFEFNREDAITLATKLLNAVSLS